MRRRRTYRGLTNSRIYRRSNKFSLFWPEPIEHPKTGKVAKWHVLCAIGDGEDRARDLARDIIKHNHVEPTEGDLPAYMERYRLRLLRLRERDRPKEPARAKLFDEANKELTRICRRIAEAFSSFDVAEVWPVDIAKFVDQWEGLRTAQIYKARLSDFFNWTIRKGVRDHNPATPISVEKPEVRKTYITDAQFFAVYDALLTGADGKRTPTGPMLQCYVDLCYLLYQRATEVRLLKWDQVDKTVIHFKPTKTEKTSGATVDVPITASIRAVLERAREIGVVKSAYVIHTLRGQPYNTRGIGTAWVRACERAKVEGVTLKDLRAKALTDAKKAGYALKQLSVAAAHTDEKTTADYIKRRETPVSEVAMVLPLRPKK